MNQNDQMREAIDRLIGEIVCLEGAVLNKDPWAELEIRVRDIKKIAEQALAAKPGKLLRLTTQDIGRLQHGDVTCWDWEDTITFANAIMNDMERINGAHS